ncbi:MAG: glycosyltransferase [Flavobacteriales bacterium]|nr:glycosyltransferase [Flavobacteriales bacterium]
MTNTPLPRIAIATPKADAYSETFIAAHIQRIPGVVRVLVEGNLPRQVLNGPRLIRAGRTGRALDLAEAVAHGTTVEGLIARRVARVLRRDRIDVVLAEYGDTGNAMLEPCRRAGCALVVHFFGYDAHRGDVIAANNGYKQVFAQAKALVVVSRAMEEQLVRLGAPREKVVYNSCGADVQRFSAARPADAPPHFLAVGRFVDKKAPHLLLEAFRQVLAQRPQARLTMVGKGPLWESCAGLVKALGLQEQVSLPGVLAPEAIAERLRKSRAFVQHSVLAHNGDSEGTPVAILEAMAAGVPVVATAHAGIADVVPQGECGLLCAEHDVSAMAAHMIALVDDPQRAGAMGSAARAHVEAHYRMETSIDVLHAVLMRAAAQ